MSEPPKAVWEGEIMVGSLQLRVAVLEDGTRIIHAESVARLFKHINEHGLKEEELLGLAEFTYDVKNG